MPESIVFDILVTISSFESVFDILVTISSFESVVFDILVTISSFESIVFDILVTISSFERNAFMVYLFLIAGAPDTCNIQVGTGTAECADPQYVTVPSFHKILSATSLVEFIFIKVVRPRFQLL